MSEQILYASDVNIKTGTIEVKVMKIGNKQVTLAVFRQLPAESVIDLQTGELSGEPWGRVNYHVDCEYYPTHIHVVWQKGNELRRAIAFLPWNKGKGIVMPSNAYSNILSELSWGVYNLLRAKALEGWKPDNTRQLHQSVWVEDRWIFTELDRDETLYMFWNSPSFEALKQKLREEHAKGEFPWDSQSIYTKVIIPLHQELCQLQAQWQQSYSQLEQLDQLFIAV